ncbi:hypothetical protein LOK49_LG01G03880 [Camellia lanceoleosa]|uniref:Uncharacterized protein n=1 Tax=Camellia lanceoleosa TaxID=1840588 RepID=A0ACC0J6M3_9ERIC|nr:hypothetical protein LOK49_LG01G03880 [Camellia lanceoleosa]
MTKMVGGEMLTQLGSTMAGLMFIWAMFKQYFPFDLQNHIEQYAHKLIGLVYPYIQITFHEYSGDGFERSKAYAAIERYLSTNSSSRAKRLKADMVRDSKSLILSMDDHEEITDEFRGIKVKWASRKTTPNRQVISFYGDNDEKLYYKLTFHRRHREIVTGTYLNHVMEEGKAIGVKSRQRKIFTNNRGEQWVGSRRTMWSHVVFEHPATFDTLAMEPKKKQEIINDLITFTKSKDYYKKIGKAWKRAVKDNSELRKLLIDTSGKSIIVIEDIDCSLDLTGQRKKKEKEKGEKKDGDKANPIEEEKKKKDAEDSKDSKVTLSGLLNFIDGLWSACGGEKIIVFTTNYVEKLDPALIRRGRMDKHIEMSYCSFEAFKVLARNYLDLESHDSFETIRGLLEENKITPADVAENLMPKSSEEDADTCLKNLMEAIERLKEEARLKAEEEEKAKAEEEEERLKAEKEKEKEKEQKSAEEEKEKKTSVPEVKENGVIT